MQGSASGDFEHGYVQRLYRTDSNLSSDFPFKNGSSNNQMSICLFFSPESDMSWNCLTCKCGGYLPAGYSWGLSIWDDSGTKYVRFWIYYTSSWIDEAIAAVFPNGGAYVNDQWYHVGVTFDRTSKQAYMKLYDITEASATEVSDTFSNTMQLCTTDFSIGAHAPGASRYAFDGNIDELVVFGDILSEAEIDEIRAGTYRVGPAPLTFSSTSALGSYADSGPTGFLTHATALEDNLNA